jgi:ABC-type uncharacterized transport system auxiliary subunit
MRTWRRFSIGGSLGRSFLLLWFVLILLSGCSMGGKRNVVTRQYILEYSPAAPESLSRIDELIKVDRFFVAQAYNTPSMIYQEAPFQQSTDPYNSWRANPAEMVSDYLLRDLRQAGIFRGVLPYQSTDYTRFVLEGRVEQFFQLTEKEGSKAVLDVYVTLLDQAQKNLVERVIFQRDYRYAESLEDQSPKSFAQGMSRAMEKLSRQVAIDLYHAAKP